MCTSIGRWVCRWLIRLCGLGQRDFGGIEVVRRLVLVAKLWCGVVLMPVVRVVVIFAVNLLRRVVRLLKGRSGRHGRVDEACPGGFWLVWHIVRHVSRLMR